jgi:hypothetical protein
MVELFLGIVGAAFVIGGFLVVLAMIVQDIRKSLRNR